MKKKIKQIIKNPLFSGSAVMIIGTNATNIINYIYHLIMGRLLGPSSYGELSALFSLVGLLGIISVALNLVIVKYISSAHSKGEVNGLIQWFTRYVFFITFFVFLVIAAVSPMISSFLKINNTFLVILVAVMFVFGLLSAVNKAALQGLLNFNKTVITVLLENSTKLLLGILLVYLGFSVGGAMAALVVSALFGFLLSRQFLAPYFEKVANINLNLRQLATYIIPVFLQSIAITSLYSSDIVLVKHFFNSHQAGLYAAISTLGKIIYYGAGPIGLVMFPIVSKRESQGQSHQKVLIYSLVLTCILAFGVLGAFALFPSIVIRILFGSSYLEAGSLLVWFGIFITLFTLSVFLINYSLSLKQTKIVVLPILAAVIQIIGIGLFHNNLYSVVMVSIVTCSLLLISLSLYTMRRRLLVTK